MAAPSTPRKRRAAPAAAAQSPGHSKTLRELGLTPSIEEPYLYMDPERKVMLLFHVDNILVLHRKERCCNRSYQIEKSDAHNRTTPGGQHSSNLPTMPLRQSTAIAK
ncbi:hypothetical protein CONLIGDRAFT_650669 [Coniochaeta ligniaria NRRL 30616]|uniref:Reverse transcriptase Ty1/copia-type domain-containing protein n=1 Tax=Coniochaeta ligniaria NRRL 30616 TaxID=1408157 RepID=A0A1J7IXG7_9PEZI|nr:hypothetical protein CONLIGDRAFT_650669 [Coniochaeta ligniaria NRRL 30616]